MTRGAGLALVSASASPIFDREDVSGIFEFNLTAAEMAALSAVNVTSDTRLLHSLAFVKGDARRRPAGMKSDDGHAGKRQPDSRRNVVLMVMDDARPDMNYAYGQTFMHTPNMDRLAKTGMVFRRAYSQFAVCSPSRNSFM